MEELRQWLEGLSVQHRLYAQAGLLVVVLVLAWVANFITKEIVLRIVRRFVKKSKTQWDDILDEHRVFTLLSHLVPAVIIYKSAPIVFIDTLGGGRFMEVASVIYMIVIGMLVVNAFLSSVIDIYRTYAFARRMPIRGFVQVVKIIVFIAGSIIILGFILGRDPTSILAGFGAMTAVTMLIFKDAILGFVAGIQLSANNMVHIGDWISMPKYGADGDVTDITLTTVKVQNWDKTISTIPAYSLISESFQNWRGMSESGGRRIKRAVHIDMNTIRFCDEAMLAKFGRIQHLAEYIDTKKREIDEHNKADNVDDGELVNGRRMTNIGSFRAYVIAYLKHHPKINQNMTFLVRQLKPTECGLPIEIYVFCNDQIWANYEAIQADIFDHILAVVPEFGLRVFQNPAGADFAKLTDR
ncbi:MAG: mechanosensitive ion channel family protein [Planctomycetota bacterium]|nr:MAG: mechanosensitive ion channel family protein [Planctomycetota bacterium]